MFVGLTNSEACSKAIRALGDIVKGTRDVCPFKSATSSNVACVKDGAIQLHKSQYSI
jgi:hypothetical protein